MRKREKATRERLAAFNISSSDMKMMMMIATQKHAGKAELKSSPLTKR